MPLDQPCHWSRAQKMVSASARRLQQNVMKAHVLLQICAIRHRSDCSVQTARTIKNGPVHQHRPVIHVLFALLRRFSAMLLVRLAGIEPTTPWFVAKYSIQLSYSRKNCIITLKFFFGKFHFPSCSADSQ
jgi:hypothetical protein